MLVFEGQKFYKEEWDQYIIVKELEEDRIRVNVIKEFTGKNDNMWISLGMLKLALESGYREV